MQRLISLITIWMLSFSLIACNTVHGFGKDVQKAGNKVGGSLERASDK